LINSGEHPILWLIPHPKPYVGFAEIALERQAWKNVSRICHQARSDKQARLINDSMRSPHCSHQIHNSKSHSEWLLPAGLAFRFRPLLQRPCGLEVSRRVTDLHSVITKINIRDAAGEGNGYSNKVHG
jgi:hypothetical protein